MLGRCGLRIIRRPCLSRRIEDRTAAEEQVLMRPQRKSGWLAEIDREFCFDLAGGRIDSRDRPMRTRAVSRTIHLRDGEIEPAAVAIPHRLLCAVGRIRERDVLPDGELSGFLIDAKRCLDAERLLGP